MVPTSKGLQMNFMKFTKCFTPHHRRRGCRTCWQRRMWMEIHPTTCTALQRIMGCNCQIPEVPSTTTISFSHCYLWRTFHITCRDRGLSKFQNVGALSDDPFNPTYLSPGHVIIGEPLTQLPAAEYTNVKCKRLSSWQTYQQQIKKFWQRWWSY